jgi:hypothetical protein
VRKKIAVQGLSRQGLTIVIEAACELCCQVLRISRAATIAAEMTRLPDLKQCATAPATDFILSIITLSVKILVLTSIEDCMMDVILSVINF